MVILMTIAGDHIMASHSMCLMTCVAQSRVLTYGISGAIFFRAFMITLGAVTLQVLRLLSVKFQF